MLLHTCFLRILNQDWGEIFKVNFYQLLYYAIVGGMLAGFMLKLVKIAAGGG
jgi:hypothetical protein